MAANYDQSTGASRTDDSGEVPVKRARTDSSPGKDEDEKTAGMNSKCRYKHFRLTMPHFFGFIAA